MTDALWDCGCPIPFVGTAAELASHMGWHDSRFVWRVEWWGGAAVVVPVFDPAAAEVAA